MNRTSCSRAIAIVVVATIVMTEHVWARPASVPTLLDRYAQHHFDVAQSVGEMSLLDLGLFVDEFERRGHQWVATGTAAAISDRRLVAATFALDAARTMMEAGHRRLGDRLVAWGCAELRLDGKPLPAERWWHLAAVALFEGMGEDTALTGGGGFTISDLEGATGGRGAATEDATDGHFAHAKARFPDEPRILLAEVVIEEKRTWSAGVSDAQGVTRIGILPGELTAQYLSRLAIRSKDAATAFADGTADATDRQASTDAAAVKRLGALALKLRDLSKYPAIAPEVHLRYGLIALRFAERDIALQHFKEVEKTTHEPYLVYLARLFSGVAHDRLAQLPEAAASYQSALDVIPRAPTASLMLGAALLRSGHLTEAGRAADVFLSEDTSTSDPVDPWRSYHQGDYWRLSSYLDALRAALP